MPDIPLFWLFVVGAAVFSFIVRGVQRVQTRAAREQWADAASQLELALTGRNLRALTMKGSEGPLRVTVDLQRSDNSTSTRYRVDLPPLGFKLGISKQSEWHQFVKVFGAQDLEIGDPDFDNAFMVKTSSPERARAYLSPARAAALRTLATKHPGVSFVDNQLVLTTGGVAKKADKIVSTVRDLMEAAQALLPDAGVSEPAASTVEAREEELQQVFDTLEEYVEIAEEEATTTSVDAVIPEATATSVTDQNAALAAARLFGAQQLGFETDRRFNDEYLDTTVEWAGTVQRPGGLSAGRMFEDEDHEIVEINVATLEDDLYGSSSIDAVVAFPAGSTTPERGEPVRFTGRLIGIDALTKKLFVAEGRLG